MSRVPIRRIEMEPAKGHIQCAPRFGAPRFAGPSRHRDVDPDKQQEISELGTQESGNEMYSEIGNSNHKVGDFPDGGRSDRSVRRHPAVNPKVDTIPTATDREKGQSPHRQIDGKRSAQRQQKETEAVVKGMQRTAQIEQIIQRAYTDPSAALVLADWFEEQGLEEQASLIRSSGWRWNVRCRVAQNPSTPPEALTQLAQDEDLYVRRRVAQNLSTPPEALTQLAQDEYLYVRENVALNTSTPPEALTQLAQDEDLSVRSHVAQNLSTPPEALTQLAQDEDLYVRRRVAQNLSTPPEALTQLAQDEDVSVRNRVALNTSTPPEVLAQLAQDEDLYVRYYAMNNPNYPGEGRQDNESDMSREALHLVLDPRLRGQVNSVVEEMGVDWDDLESVSYGMMMEPGFEPLEKWHREEREGMVVFHADTPARQAQGLQYADPRQFPKNAVMLFPNCQGAFHMRNCRFPIDITFIDDDMRVLGVRQATPGNELYRAPYGTKHAVESHPGFLRVEIGDILPFAL